MEADWSVEIGQGLPLIDSTWEGFVDLRVHPRAIDSLPEAVQHPALRQALLALNEKNSPVFTTKCDAWALDEKIDPDEFDATSEDSQTGFASYIDILERDATRFCSFKLHEERIRTLSSQLRQVALRNGRVDFVLRTAAIKEQQGYGFTLYAAGCGAHPSMAYAAWQSVLGATVAATITAAHSLHTGE